MDPKPSGYAEDDDHDHNHFAALPAELEEEDD